MKVFKIFRVTNTMQLKSTKKNRRADVN
jgi:hypothetical protein